MAKETSQPEHGDALAGAAVTDGTADQINDTDAAAQTEDVVADAAASEPVADETSAKATKATAKADARSAEKAKKAAERARIERSKQIAAEARGKSYTPKGSKAQAATGKPLTKEQERAAAHERAVQPEGNPVWFKPIMFGFLLLGLLWILVFYLSSGRAPVEALGNWNILVGFGIALVGFLMMSNWK